MADEDAIGRLVFEYGYAGPDWAVLRHGYLPTYSLRDHDVYSSARIMVVSKSVRGCWIL